MIDDSILLYDDGAVSLLVVHRPHRVVQHCAFRCYLLTKISIAYGCGKDYSPPRVVARIAIIYKTAMDREME